MGNQETTVLNWLRGQSIEKVEAEKIGIMNLPAVISRLRKKNYPIKKAYKARPNSDKTRIVEVAEYYLS